MKLYDRIKGFFQEEEPLKFIISERNAKLLKNIDPINFESNLNLMNIEIV